MVVVERGDDERVLRKLLCVSLLRGTVHVGVPPRAPLHVLRELGTRDDGVLEFVVHLVSDRNVVENLGGPVMVGPLPDREPPGRDGLQVLRFVEVYLSELEIDLGCPGPLLRQQRRILNAFDAGGPTFDRIGDLVLVPVVVRERDAEVFDRLGSELGAGLAGLTPRVVGPLHQLAEVPDRVRVAAGAVVRPGDLVEREIVVSVLWVLENLAVRSDREVECVGAPEIVEVILADPEPGLAHEAGLWGDRLAGFVGVDERASYRRP